MTPQQNALALALAVPVLLVGVAAVDGGTALAITDVIQSVIDFLQALLEVLNSGGS